MVRSYFAPPAPPVPPTVPPEESLRPAGRDVIASLRHRVARVRRDPVGHRIYRVVSTTHPPMPLQLTKLAVVGLALLVAGSAVSQPFAQPAMKTPGPSWSRASAVQGAQCPRATKGTIRAPAASASSSCFFQFLHISR